MKKLLPIILLICISSSVFASATVTQKEFRWRNDNGSETSATWRENQGQSTTWLCVAPENVRLRMSFLVLPDGPPKSVFPYISYSTSPGGPYTMITEDGSKNAFMLSVSDSVSSNDSTTQQLNTPGNHPYQKGIVLDANYTPNILFYSISGDTIVTEYEWVITPTNKIQLGTYYFQLEGLNGYDPLPSMFYQGPTGSSQTITACDSLVSPSGLYTYKNSGTFRDTLINGIGCDSIITTFLTINQTKPVSANDTSLICSGNTTISISGSGKGINYYLRNDANDSIVRGPVAGNGFAISLNTGNLSSSTVFNVNAIIPSKALNFDGSDDVITISDATGIPSGNSSYTIEAWIKPDVSATNGIAGWGNYGTTNEVNAFRLGSGGQLHNYWWGNDLTVSAPGLTDGNWHHVAATFDGTTRKIIIDGVVIGSDTPTGHNVTMTSNFTVGKTWGTEYFDGGIDEVRIWDVARTEAEITGAMRSCLSGTETGLVVYYQLNEGTGIVTADIAGGNNTGTLTNMNTSTVWVKGTDNCGCAKEFTTKLNVHVNPIAEQISADTSVICSGATVINLSGSEEGVNYYLRNDANDSIVAGPLAGTGSAIAFNTDSVTATTVYNVNAMKTTLGLTQSGNSNYVLIGNSADVQLNTGTIEAWFNTTDAGSGFRGIIVKQSAYGLFLMDNELVAFDWTTNNPVLTGIFPNDGKWHHVALVFDSGVTDGSRLYFDGAVIDTFTYTIADHSQALVIGEGGNPSFQNFNGSIDNVRVWNTLLTGADIQNNSKACLSGTETGLVAYYQFEEMPGSTTVKDLAGGNNNGSLINTDPATWQAGIDNACCSTEMTVKPTVSIKAIPNQTATPAQAMFCDSASTTIDLPSLSGFNYFLELHSDSTLVEGPISGTGSLLNLNTGTIYTTTTYHVYVEKATDATCFAQMTPPATVTLAPATNINVSASGDVITAAATGASSYQWIDCDNGNAIIGGATFQSFTATVNGNYAVIVTENSCPDTSVCVNITTVGISEYSKLNTQVSVYPNPNNGTFVIKANAEGTYTIQNSVGQSLQVISLTGTNNNTATITNLDNGVYFILNDKGMLQQKIVVVK